MFGCPNRNIKKIYCLKRFSQSPELTNKRLPVRTEAQKKAVTSVPKSKSSVLQAQSKRPISTKASSVDKEKSEDPEPKRPRDTVSNDSETPTAASTKNLPLRGQYTHPMQLNNERSPVNTGFQLPSLREPLQGSQDMPKPTVQNNNLESTASHDLLRHSNSLTVSHQPSSIASGAGGPRNGSADTEALAAALASTEYEQLKQQLANLSAAKKTGQFTHQIAVSVEALFNCFDGAKEKTFTKLQSMQTKTQDQVIY